MDLPDEIGVRIKLTKPEHFLTIKETLTRIGIASKKNNVLYQSAHILHRKGEYAILHFKEFFILDGKKAELSSDDVKRRNRIAHLLEQWDLAKIDDEKEIENDRTVSLKIIPHKEKKDWTLVEKFNVGKKK